MTELERAAETLNMAGIHAGGNSDVERKVRRACTALVALRAFAEGCLDATPQEPITDIVTDLLVDLRHLAAELDLDYERIDERAAGHFDVERY